MLGSRCFITNECGPNENIQVCCASLPSLLYRSFVKQKKYICKISSIIELLSSISSLYAVTLSQFNTGFFRNSDQSLYFLNSLNIYIISAVCLICTSKEKIRQQMQLIKKKDRNFIQKIRVTMPAKNKEQEKENIRHLWQSGACK